VDDTDESDETDNKREEVAEGEARQNDGGGEDRQDDPAKGEAS